MEFSKNVIRPGAALGALQDAAPVHACRVVLQFSRACTLSAHTPRAKAPAISSSGVLRRGGRGGMVCLDEVLAGLCKACSNMWG